MSFLSRNERSRHYHSLRYRLSSKMKQKRRLITMWNKADINKMKELVSEEVNEFINNNTTALEINSLWGKFKQISESAMQLVPKRYTFTRYSKPCIKRECKRICRRKKRAYRRAKENKWHNRLGNKMFKWQNVTTLINSEMD